MPVSTKYTDPSFVQFERSLGQRLVPVADQIRDLATKFGLRPYKVRLVRVRWSGGERGVGTPVAEHEEQILPTPLILDLTTMTAVVQPVGLDEVGLVGLAEVSGRYTEDQLRFLNPDGGPPGRDEEVFYEVEFLRPDGLEGERRRFYLRTAPYYNPGRLQWMLRLERAHDDRQRNGDPL